MAEEKNYILPLIAIVAIVAIVGLVIMFLNMGTARTAELAASTATPAVQQATQIASGNVAGGAVQNNCDSLIDSANEVCDRAKSTHSDNDWANCDYQMSLLTRVINSGLCKPINN